MLGKADRQCHTHIRKLFDGCFLTRSMQAYALDAYIEADLEFCWPPCSSGASARYVNMQHVEHENARQVGTYCSGETRFNNQGAFETVVGVVVAEASR